MMETEKRIIFLLKFIDGIDIKFIVDERAYQGLSIGMLYFSFCKLVQKLLQKEK